ncbi:hypothetical protein EWM64_g10009 [Hericium alpestre]|uniref:HAT C-terminal dimerisation domain-containing protein n=1 Tax=Hericium alpestre TaxID=135208 RepID=A0A4Y9ZJD4_9AGAM|nr:hypothetical protein EWM64_g10009 [Hericium alpestre]
MLDNSYTHILIVSSQILKDATSFFSRGTPNLVTVIPAMDHIDQRLTSDSLDTKFHPAICASLNVAKRTLNHYYTMTDLSEVYRIAMVLHPRHKLTYFKNVKWEQEWIDTARDVVRDEFECSYASREVEGDKDGQPEAAHEENEATNTNIFDNLPALSAPTANDGHDELERYLSTDPKPIGDALAWWSHPKHAADFPRLSRMALDYLSIPATSVAVERVFSHGRLLLTHVRNRLSAQTTCVLLCLGNWSLLGLIKDSDVVKVASLSDVEDDEDPMEEYMMDLGWDSINL